MYHTCEDDGSRYSDFFAFMERDYYIASFHSQYNFAFGSSKYTQTSPLKAAKIN